MAGRVSLQAGALVILGSGETIGEMGVITGAQDIARAQHPTGRLSAVAAELLDGQDHHQLLKAWLRGEGRLGVRGEEMRRCSNSKTGSKLDQNHFKSHN